MTGGVAWKAFKNAQQDAVQKCLNAPFLCSYSIKAGKGFL